MPLRIRGRRVSGKGFYVKCMPLQARGQLFLYTSGLALLHWADPAVG